jgi:hypothetical protein
MKRKDDNGRNKLKVGKNNASYNDKHTHNPIILRPISTTLLSVRNFGPGIRRVLSFRNFGKTDMIIILRRAGYL